jgi:hypothetical protein
MSVTHGKDTANKIDFLLVMGRADLEWEFTSFSKEWGDQVRTDPAVFSLLSMAK